MPSSGKPVTVNTVRHPADRLDIIHHREIEKEHDEKKTGSDRNHSRNDASIESSIEISRIAHELFMYDLIERGEVSTKLDISRLETSEEPFSGIDIVREEDLIEVERSLHECIE